MINKNRKKLFAFGLIEVIVAIAISGIVLTGAVAVATRSIQLVRRGEMEDLSNGILVRSLEISRSPVDFDLNKELGKGAGPLYFTLTEGEGGKLVLERSLGAQFAIEDCSANSEYKVDLAAFDKQGTYIDEDFREGYIICNQVEITEVSSNNQNLRRTFQVRSIVVYDVFNETYKRELISYRTEIIDED